VSDRAQARRIRLHESRHTACSLMEKAGVPVSVIAAWAGHYSGAFTMSQYVHANPDDLPLAVTHWPRSTVRGCSVSGGTFAWPFGPASGHRPAATMKGEWGELGV
jgi:integrase-like protein